MCIPACNEPEGFVTRGVCDQGGVFDQGGLKGGVTRGDVHPQTHTPPSNLSTSGWYVSCWSAFLFMNRLNFHSIVVMMSDFFQNTQKKMYLSVNVKHNFQESLIKILQAKNCILKSLGFVFHFHLLLFIKYDTISRN